MGKLGDILNQFILPLLYAANAAVFFASFLFLILGAYFMLGKDQAASGAAMILFGIGCVLMYTAAFSLIGLLRKSSGILWLVILVLFASMIALFALMVVCFVLGFEMPSIRDIVVQSWQEGCASTADTSGCLQAELASNKWCYDNVPDKTVCVAADGTVTPASQKMHQCSLSCQTEWIKKTSDLMGTVAVSAIVSLFILFLVTMHNSQTHHGIWCVKPSDNEDDDENTVQNIPPVMAYPAYLLNGALALSGALLAIAAWSVLDDATTFTALFTILIGVGYFVFGAIACVAIAKNAHFLLRLRFVNMHALTVLLSTPRSTMN
jgi:hypothetical protein|eukprot:SAG25_NODE_107_length_15283_cov_3.516728_15_plen_321_part_00